MPIPPVGVEGAALEPPALGVVVVPGVTEVSPVPGSVLVLPGVVTLPPGIPVVVPAPVPAVPVDVAPAVPVVAPVTAPLAPDTELSGVVDDPAAAPDAAVPAVPAAPVPALVLSVIVPEPETGRPPGIMLSTVEDGDAWQTASIWSMLIVASPDRVTFDVALPAEVLAVA